jgi:hypothetical protein
MMDLLLSTFVTVTPAPPYPQPWEGLSDPWDQPVWAAAKLGDARYVVSENTNDFPPPDHQGRHVWEGIEYTTGREFLDLVAAATLD